MLKIIKVDLRLSFRFLGCLHNSHNGAPDWAKVSNPTKLQTASRKWISRVSNSHWLHFPTMTIIESGNLSDRPFFMSVQKRGVLPLLWIFKGYLISAKKWIDLRLSFRFHGYHHNSHNGASDWALRLNSYQASNWLYELYPRVSNSHWLHFPNTTIIESGDLSDRPFLWAYKKRGVPPLWFFIVRAVSAKNNKSRLASIFQIPRMSS